MTITLDQEPQSEARTVVHAALGSTGMARLSAAVVGAVAAALSWSGRGGFVIGFHSDVAAYVTSIVARMSSDGFVGDLLLEDPSNLEFSRSLLTGVMSVLIDASGSPALAVGILHLGAVFIWAYSHIVVMTRVSGSSLLGTALSVPALGYMNLSAGEFLGVPGDPIARFVVGAFIPFVAMTTIRFWSGEVSAWSPLLRSLSLIAIHPHTGAAVSFAVLLVLVSRRLLRQPTDGRLRDVTLWCLVSGGVVVGYAGWYLGVTRVDVTLDAERIGEIEAFRIPSYVDQGDLISGLLSGVSPYLIIALTVATVLMLSVRTARSVVGPILLLLFGILVFAVLIPWLDSGLQELLGIRRLQYDLPRALRLVPTLTLFIVAAAMGATRRLTPTRFRGPVSIVVGLAILAAGANLVMAEDSGMRNREISAGARCARDGELPCPPSGRQQELLAIASGATAFDPARYFVFEDDVAQAIRHTALRSVVFTFKDGGWLLYSRDHPRLERWYAGIIGQRTLRASLEEVLSSGETGLSEYLRLVGFASSYGAQVMVLPESLIPPSVVIREVDVAFRTTEHVAMIVDPALR